MLPSDKRQGKGCVERNREIEEGENLGLSLLCPGSSSPLPFRQFSQEAQSQGQDTAGTVGLLGHGPLLQLTPASAGSGSVCSPQQHPNAIAHCFEIG